MGNDNSKTTIENQQMILQLQQQIINQQRQHPSQQHSYQHSNNLPHQKQNNQMDIGYDGSRDYNLPVISPAELQQRTEHPSRMPAESTMREKPRSLLDILHDKRLMVEIDKNPNTKRKFLERLLNEHRHVMTTTQVQRISGILESLPPADNGYQSKRNITSNSTSNRNNNREPANMRFDDMPKLMDTPRGFNHGTTRQDATGRELQTREQLNTIDALTKHYKTEAEKEEAEFKLEEERRRKEFLERQRQRRANYQSKLSDLERDQVDALKLFNLQANYSLDDLKQAYKKMAMRTHPDKPTGNAEQFQLVTKCYLSLLEKYKARESDRQFDDLKKGSQTYLEDQTKSRMVNKHFNKNTTTGGTTNTSTSAKVDKDKFDIKLFNKIYEQNKLWDSNDDGYGSWFSSQETDEAPVELFGNKFNLNVFNSTFEDHKERLTAQSGAIQQYNEPRELVSYSGGFTDIEQDARKVEDFSKPSPVAPTGKSARDLGYTDLKTAYSARGAFIDPNKVEYKTYKNVDELKRDRGNIRYDMTPEEMRIYEMKKYKEQEEEERRQHLIQQRDSLITNSYSRIHEKMLGYRGSAPS